MLFGDKLTIEFEIAEFLYQTFSSFVIMLEDKKEERYTHDILARLNAKLFSFQLVTAEIMHDLLNVLSSHWPLGPCTVPAWAINDGQTVILVILPHNTYSLNESNNHKNFSRLH